jgi:DNA-binding response OmpR family regulator
MQRQLLLAEEDPCIRQFLADNLSADGFNIHQADDHDHAQQTLADMAPDLILADVNGQTLGLLDWLRSEDKPSIVSREVPVLVLSSCGDAVHRIRLLERGADDVVEKPFSYPELRARITALLRRANPERPPRLTVAGPVRIDHRTRTVTVDGRVVSLSGFEHRLLCHLMTDPSRVFTREELLREVWGYQCPGEARTRTLDTHAHRLRTKLRQATSVPLLINVWGVGYRLTAPPVEPATVGTVWTDALGEGRAHDRS